MAQNLNEALLRLELEVVGANAIKEAAEAVQRYGAATKALQPARVDTIIGAIDLATPAYKQVAAGMKELDQVAKQLGTSITTFNRGVLQNAAAIRTNFEAVRTQMRLYDQELRNLRGDQGQRLVPDALVTRSLRPVRQQITGDVTQAMGLLPADVAALSSSDRLYRAAEQSSVAINRSGSQDPMIAAEARLRAFRAARTVARLAPGVLGEGITQDPNYQVIRSATSPSGSVRPEDLQAALAQLAPLMAQQNLVNLYRTALRVTASQSLSRPMLGPAGGFVFGGPQEPSSVGRRALFGANRPGYGALGALDPGLVARLQGSIEPDIADLDQAALLLASRPHLIRPGPNLPAQRLSDLQKAQLLRIRSFGHTDEEDQLLYETARTKIISQVEGTSFEGGRALDYMPTPAGDLRPRSGDVRARLAGSRQRAPLLPTAIETTIREISPPSENQLRLIAAAEAAAQQSRGMVPGETILERFQRIGYGPGVQKIQARLAALKANRGLPIPTRIDLPEEAATTAMEEAEAEAEARLRSKRKRKGPFDLGEGGFARFKRSGSMSQQAEDLLAEYGKPTIFPSVFSKKMGVSPEAGQLLIRDLQSRGFLGEASGTGLASALPIIGSTERRSKQAVAEAALTEATEQETVSRRRAAKAAQKQAIVQEEAVVAGGGGGRIGGGGGKGKGTGGDDEPPPPGAFSRMGSRFTSRFAGLTSFVGAAAIIYPIVSLISSSIGAAVELEAHVKRIQAIYGSHNLGDQLLIKKEIVQAAKDLGENVNQVAEAAQQFAQAQTPIADLPKNLHAATVGAKAFGTSIKEIADYIIAVQATTGGKTTGMQAVDILASISKRTAVSIPSLMASIQNIGPALEPFAPTKGNISNESLLGAITGVESNVGRVTGAQTGAALRFLIGRLGNPAGVSRIQNLTGVNLATTESRGTELRPFVEILNDLSVAYERLLKTGRSGEAQELLRELFGARQVTTGTILLTHFKNVLDLVTGGLNDEGAAAKMAADQLDTTKTAVEKLKVSLTDLMTHLIPIGNRLASIFTPVVEVLTAIANAVPTNITKLDLLPGAMGNFGSVAAKAIQDNPATTRAFIGEGITQRFDRRGNPIPVVGGGVNSILTTPIPGAASLILPGGGIRPTLPATVAQQVATIGAKDAGTKLFGDPAQFDAAFDKLTDRTKGQNEVFTQLGIGINNAKSRLNELRQAIVTYFSTMNIMQQEDRKKQLQKLLGMFNETDLQVAADNLRIASFKFAKERESAQFAYTKGVARLLLKPTGEETTPQELFVRQATVIGLEREIQEHALTKEYENQVELFKQQYSQQELSVTELASQIQIAGLGLQVEKEKLNLQTRLLLLQEQITMEDKEQLELRKQRVQAEKELGSTVLKSLTGLAGGFAQARNGPMGLRAAHPLTMLADQLIYPIGQDLFGRATKAIGGIFESGTKELDARGQPTGRYTGRGLLGGVGAKFAGLFTPQQYPIKAPSPPPTVENAGNQGLGGAGMASAYNRTQYLEKLKAWQDAKTEFDKQQAKNAAITAFGVEAGTIAGSAIGGNQQGAQIGSAVGAIAGQVLIPIPGVGAAIGAVVGGVLGGLIGGHPKPQPEIGHLQIIADNSREQVRLLENTNKLLAQNFLSFNVPTGFTLPSYQPGSFGGMAAARGGGGGGVVNSSINVAVNVGGTNVSAEKLGSTIAQAISDRLELESRSAGGYVPRLLYG